MELAEKRKHILAFDSVTWLIATESRGFSNKFRVLSQLSIWSERADTEDRRNCVSRCIR